ncbi:MAG: hypothetical protein ACRC80_00275 [Waterburya sp.]
MSENNILIAKLAYSISVYFGYSSLEDFLVWYKSSKKEFSKYVDNLIVYLIEEGFTKDDITTFLTKKASVVAETDSLK